MDHILADCKYPETLISFAQNKKLSETGGLAKCLELKIGANVMVTVNFDIQDMLIRFEVMNSIAKNVYLKFQDSLLGRKAILSDYFAQQNCFVPLQKCDADIPICKGSISTSNNERKFHLCCHGNAP